MQVREYGSSGPVVILVHGGPGAPGYLAPVARELAGSFRVVKRLVPSPATGTGTPTDELMRQILLLTVLQASFGFDIAPYLVAAFLLNSASTLVPFGRPHLVRSKAKSATSILSVNVALAVAWRVPVTSPFVAAAFLGTYLYSFVVCGVGWLRRA